MEFLESNNLLVGWSGFELESTPVQPSPILSLALVARPSLGGPVHREEIRKTVGLLSRLPGRIIWCDLMASLL